MGQLFVWIAELLKLAAGRKLHPLTTRCPVCQQAVRLHVNYAGRRHMLAHARALYEGSKFSVHYAANIKCVGSGAPSVFNPRPNEPQQFKLPASLLEE
jgi:hypothetical protein